MYKHKTNKRLSEEIKKKMSTSHLLLNQCLETKLKRSEFMRGVSTIQYTCRNSSLNIEEICLMQKGLKNFCKKYGLYLHLAKKIVNKNQKYLGWTIEAKRLYDIKKEEFEKENRYYTYIYLDPRKPGAFSYGEYSFDYEPFYVGKGGRGDTATNKRWKHHLTKKDNNTFKHHKIKNIIKEGYQPIIRIFKTFDTEEKSLELEMNLIKTIGRSDLGKGPLTNFTDGGDRGFNLSEEGRQKISDSLKGNIPWNRYRTISTEQKLAISKKVSKIVPRKPIDPDIRPLYIPEKREIKYKYSEESRRKMSLSAIGKKAYNKGKKTGKPAWNRGLRILISREPTTEEQTIALRKNSVLNQPVAQYTLDNKLVKVYQSQRDASRITGFKREGIKDCCSGRQLSSCGYIWKKFSKKDQELILS
jgi:hypothetical protein